MFKAVGGAMRQGLVGNQAHVLRRMYSSHVEVMKRCLAPQMDWIASALLPGEPGYPYSLDLCLTSDMKCWIMLEHYYMETSPQRKNYNLSKPFYERRVVGGN